MDLCAAAFRNNGSNFQPAHCACGESEVEILTHRSAARLSVARGPTLAQHSGLVGDQRLLFVVRGSTDSRVLVNSDHRWQPPNALEPNAPTVIGMAARNA